MEEKWRSVNVKNADDAWNPFPPSRLGDCSFSANGRLSRVLRSSRSSVLLRCAANLKASTFSFMIPSPLTLPRPSYPVPAAVDLPLLPVPSAIVRTPSRPCAVQSCTTYASAGTSATPECTTIECTDLSSTRCQRAP